jgi:hypothetical protein
MDDNMIDKKDSSSSTLRLLAGEALKNWNTKAVLKLLSDEDYIVRTAAAREVAPQVTMMSFVTTAMKAILQLVVQ